MTSKDSNSEATATPSDRPAKEQIPRTYRSGPSDPHTFADGPGTWVEAAIGAPVEAVWAAVTDIALPAQFSDEFQGAEWIDDGPKLGASFNGRNENSTIGSWELTSYVNRFEEGKTFGWVTSDRDNPGASWWFTLDPADEGDGAATSLRFDVSIGPGPSGLSGVLEAMPDKEPRILSGRLRELHTNMKRTVEGIRQIVESA